MIYFIKATWMEKSPIKIGATNNVAERFKSIQAYCPDRLRLIASVAGSYKDEALIHKAFCRQHIQNEWFSWSEKLEDVVQGICSGGIDAVRPELRILAEDGYGIRIKSAEGIAAIRDSTRNKSGFMRANRSKAKQAEPTS